METTYRMRALLADRQPGYTLPQPFYNAADFHQLDMQHIFAREWLFAGMSCEIPQPGNYFTLDIGDNPITVVRDPHGEVRAFHNVCRHRGSKVCLGRSGKAAKLVCPYHQWTYELDGELLFAGAAMGAEFDRSKFGLKPVHCRSAGGYLFICLAEQAPPIDAFLADLEHYLAPYRLDQAKVAVESNIVEQANWKLVIENNRECYHCNGSHPELLNSLQEWDDTDDPRATPAFKAQVARKQAEWDAQGIPHKLVFHGLRNRLVRMPLLEGTHSMTLDGQPGCKRLMGHIGSADLGALRILHLPNSWNHAMGDHLVSFRVLPLGPQETLVTTKWLVHADAVEGVDYDPAELRRVWDATNDQDRRLAEDNQRGVNSQAYEPGPYSPTFEYGVINFVDWYCGQMAAALGGAQRGQLQVVS